MNVRAKQSPKYPPGEHGRCSRERRVLCELCAASYFEVRGRRPKALFPCLYCLLMDCAMQEAARIISETATREEKGSIIPNWKCVFPIGLSQCFTFFPANLKGKQC